MKYIKIGAEESTDRNEQGQINAERCQIRAAGHVSSLNPTLATITAK